MNYTSEVLFNKNSKFITRHSFNIPYLECFWFPSKATGSLEPSVEVNSQLSEHAGVKEFVTKDSVILQSLYYGTTKCVNVCLSALHDIEKFELTTISKYHDMFAVVQEKETLSKGEICEVSFCLDASKVDLDKWGLLESSEFLSFVKLSIHGLTIPFFSLKMRVQPSVLVDSVNFLPANRPENFNLCLTFRNLTEFEVLVQVRDSFCEVKPRSLKRAIFLLEKFEPHQFQTMEQKDNKAGAINKTQSTSNSFLRCFLGKLSLIWCSKNDESLEGGSIYLPNHLFSGTNDSKSFICLNYVIPVVIGANSGADVEDWVIKCHSGQVIHLEVNCNLTNLLVSGEQDFLFKIAVEPKARIAQEIDAEMYKRAPIVLGSSEQQFNVSKLSDEQISEWTENIHILPVFPGIFSLQFHFGAKYKSREIIVQVYHQQNCFESEFENVYFLSEDEDNNNNEYFDDNNFD